MQLLTFKSDILTYPKSDPPVQIQFFLLSKFIPDVISIQSTTSKKLTHTKQQDTAILREDGLSFKFKYHATIQNEIFLEVNFTL